MTWPKECGIKNITQTNESSAEEVHTGREASSKLPMYGSVDQRTEKEMERGVNNGTVI